MASVRAFFAILRWDLAVELRRRETILNMTLLAVLLLFIGSYGVASWPQDQERFGPTFFWVAVVFAGTVGLSRTFLLEQENRALQGVLIAPIDPGVLYLAKVASAWIYILFMAVLVGLAYIVLFDFEGERWNRLPQLLLVTATFGLVYAAPGVLLSAMTTGLRGGEVLLRILLFPMMIPAIIVTLKANERIFGDPRVAAATMSPMVCVAALAALAAVYLSSGFILFAKVVEE